MSDQRPQHILCAVRSQPGGEDTVSRAIALALESGARLTFVQVVDSRLVNQFTQRGSSRKALVEELIEMAEFTLALIARQARQAGVAEVSADVRFGDVRPALKEAILASGADTLVMGHSKQGPGRSTFDGDRRAAFIAELQAAAPITVV